MTRYELLERIGAGRMAEIFRAKAVAAGGFEKPVAIKRILPHLSKDARFVELLIAESKIMSVLRHRNIVQIFDVGVGEDKTYFLVMEFVDGCDLGALQRGLERRRTRLPLDLVLHLGAEVCDALDYAQQVPAPDGQPMHLVHRDVTPSNVLVSRSGEVKLTDFGLARRPEDRRTQGGLRGRFAYVSPEQVAGLPLDGRSDVFSLGVILWELALGRRLFSAMADYEALKAVTDGDIPPPSKHDPTLPVELDAILAEALHRDLDRRLPSASELGKRLRGLRYSLETSTGDPASALARTIAGIDRDPVSLAATLAAAERGPTAGFEGVERTVVKIRTAETFAQRDPDGTGLLEARRLIEAFEDAETRMSSLPAFDEPPTGGHSLAAADERTELRPAPLELPRDTDELGATPEPATVPGPGGKVPDTLRGGQVAPAPPPSASASSSVRMRPPTSTPAPTPTAQPARAARPPQPTAPRPSSDRPARQRGSGGDWSESSSERGTGGEWTEPSREHGAGGAWGDRTPPPAEPPGPRPPAPAAGRRPLVAPGSSLPVGPSLPTSSPAIAPPPGPVSAAPWGWNGGPPPVGPAQSMPGLPASSAAGASSPDLAPTALRRWWPVGVGALAIAILSFVVTQAAIDPATELGGAATGATLDAAVDAPLDATAPQTALPSMPLDAGVDADAVAIDAAGTGDAAPAADAAPPPDASVTLDAGATLDAGDAVDAGAADAGARPATPRPKPPKSPRRKPPRRKPPERTRW